jgi:unsaturated chondroitin disaccharide hydrolase
LHQGLILHSVYHRPRGWDYLPEEQKIPSGESSMWGEYHAPELALLLLREITREPYYTFFDV